MENIWYNEYLIKMVSSFQIHQALFVKAAYLFVKVSTKISNRFRRICLFAFDNVSWK